MATLNEISHNILNLYREGRSSNNDTFSLRQINFWVKYYRALYLRREINKNGAILDSFKQSICIELEEVDESKCPSHLLGTNVVRSKEKIPTLLRGRASLLVSYVGAIDGTTRWQFVPPYAMDWQQYNLYTNKRLKAFILDDYLYVFPDCSVKHAMLRGVFEDPEELNGYNDESSVCYDSNSQFPFPVDLLPYLTQDILKNELRIAEVGKEDTSNDTIQN